MSRSQFSAVVVALACLSVLAAACYPITAPLSTYYASRGTPTGDAGRPDAGAAVPAPQTPTFTPSPEMTPTATATLTATPTVPATATPTNTAPPTLPATAAATIPAVLTAIPTPGAGAAAVPLAAASPVPTLAPQGPRKIVITEADMQRAIASGVLNQSGVDASNVQIRIANGKLSLTADRLNYGLVGVSNLAVIGTLVAQDGRLQLEIDSVSPGGFVGAMIPSVANQALAQLASQWYVEQVTMGEGQFEITIR